MDNKEKNTQIFMYLVGSFEMSAMMAMGKIKNPMTDKIEKDLTQAQFSIDILDMLTEKTKGNLTEYESKFIQNTLGQLKLNYIDEANKKTDTDKNDTKSDTETNNTDTENNTGAENNTDKENITGPEN